MFVFYVNIQIETEGELIALCSDVYSQFVYAGLLGEDVELITGGHYIDVRLVGTFACYIIPFQSYYRFTVIPLIQ